MGMDSTTSERPSEQPSAASSRVAARILQSVVTGEFAPGQSLPPERELAAQLGVSRTTAREAIHELTLKGFLKRRQGSGTVVASHESSSHQLLREMTDDERDAVEKIDLRTVMEPQVAALAALRRTESDIVALVELCSGDPKSMTEEESLRLDEDFHAAIARATQNHLIASLGGIVSEWIKEFRTTSHDTAERRAASMEGHRRILEAVIARNGEDAAAMMLEHIRHMGHQGPTAAQPATE